MAHGVRSLDDSVATILNGLGDRTRDTLVIYLSDNGFLFGEHRRFGKTDAYEGSVRVPMVIRYPAMLPRHRVTRTPWSRTWTSRRRSRRSPGFPWQADGRSLVPLLDGSAKSVRSASADRALPRASTWDPSLLRLVVLRAAKRGPAATGAW